MQLIQVNNEVMRERDYLCESVRLSIVFGSNVFSNSDNLSYATDMYSSRCFNV